MKPVTITGKTIQFSGNGREMGYPTANIRSDTDLSEGVYFGYAELDTYYHAPALIFIGVPTTVGDSEKRIEAHILDIPDTNYYDQQLGLTIEKLHRYNEHFQTVELLKIAMQEDEQAARAWFKDHENSVVEQDS